MQSNAIAKLEEKKDLVLDQKDFKLIEKDIDFLLSVPGKPQQIVELFKRAMSVRFKYIPRLNGDPILSREAEEVYSIFAVIYQPNIPSFNYIQYTMKVLSNISSFINTHILLQALSNQALSQDKSEANKIYRLFTSRMNVAGFFIKKLCDKFSSLSIEERFYLSAELILMSNFDQQKIYPSETRQILKEILYQDTRNEFFILSDIGGFDNLVWHSIFKCCFNQFEIDSLCKKINSKKLTASINRQFGNKENELLNGAQKNVLEGTLKFIFDELDQFNAKDSLFSLNSMVATSLTPSDMINLEKLDLLDSVTQIKKIFDHDYPENRSESYPYVGQVEGYSAYHIGPENFDRLIDSNNSNHNKISFKNGKIIEAKQIIRFDPIKKDLVAMEPSGLLSLTALDDSSSQPVTKSNLVKYIKHLIDIEVLKHQKRSYLGKMTLIRRDKVMQFLDIDSKDQLSETSRFFKEEIKDSIWKKKIFEAGLDPVLLDTVIKTKTISNYKNLYLTYVQLTKVVGIKVTEPWQLLCLSGEQAALKYAKDYYKITKDTYDESMNRNALFYCTFSTDKTAVRFALDDLQIGIDSSDQAIEAAALRGNCKILEYILGDLKFKNDRDLKDGQNNTLHYACWSGNLDAIRFVEKFYYNPPINPEFKSYHGNSVLHCAVQSKNIAAIRYTARMINDPKCKNNLGQTALHVAAINGDLAVVKCLYEELNMSPYEVADEGYNALHLAVANGHVHLIRYFIEELHMPATTLTMRGYNPLHVAVENGQLEALRYFIEELKMDANVLTISGDSLLNIATYSRVQSIKNYLEEIDKTKQLNLPALNSSNGLKL